MTINRNDLFGTKIWTQIVHKVSEKYLAILEKDIFSHIEKIINKNISHQVCFLSKSRNLKYEKWYEGKNGR